MVFAMGPSNCIATKKLQETKGCMGSEIPGLQSTAWKFQPVNNHPVFGSAKYLLFDAVLQALCMGGAADSTRCGPHWGNYLPVKDHASCLSRICWKPKHALLDPGGDGRLSDFWRFRHRLLGNRTPGFSGHDPWPAQTSEGPFTSSVQLTPDPSLRVFFCW